MIKTSPCDSSRTKPRHKGHFVLCPVQHSCWSIYSTILQLHLLRMVHTVTLPLCSLPYSCRLQQLWRWGRASCRGGAGGCARAANSTTFTVKLQWWCASSSLPASLPPCLPPSPSPSRLSIQQPGRARRAGPPSRQIRNANHVSEYPLIPQPSIQPPDCGA